MQHPVITDVAIKREGRFWAVKTDGKLLAVVLYRKGAEAVQDLVQRLASIPVAPKGNATVTKDPKAKPPGKKADKREPHWDGRRHGKTVRIRTRIPSDSGNDNLQAVPSDCRVNPAGRKPTRNPACRQGLDAAL